MTLCIKISYIPYRSSLSSSFEPPQVHAVFQSLCPSSGLSLGLASAQKTLASEAASITTGSAHSSHPHHHPHPVALDHPMALMAPHTNLIDPGLLRWLLQDGAVVAGNRGVGSSSSAERQGCHAAAGPSSSSHFQCVDILVATPGRLMAHLNFTPGFTLQHLRCGTIHLTSYALKLPFRCNK